MADPRQRGFLASKLVVPAADGTRDLFTLNAQVRGQQQFAIIARDEEQLIGDLLRRGCYDEGVLWTPLMHVANLKLERLSEGWLPHLVLDLDTSTKRAVDPDDANWGALLVAIEGCLREVTEEGEDNFLRALVVGGQYEDKGFGWSLHVHYPNAIYNRVPPARLAALVNELPEVQALEVECDASIWTGGVRFGRSCKGARQECPELLYCTDPNADEETVARWGFPLHRAEEPTVVWEEEADRRNLRQARDGGGAAGNVRVVPLDQQEKADQALLIYRQRFDRLARIGAVLGNRVDFVDNRQTNVCKHNNNHFALLIDRAGTEYMRVYCGGPRGEGQTRPFREFELYPAPIDLPDAELEEEEEAPERLQQLADWLGSGEQRFHVGTPYFVSDFVALGLPVPGYAVEPTGAAMCIDVVTFNALRDAGASVKMLSNYVNLALTVVASMSDYPMMRDGNGQLVVCRKPAERLGAFWYQGEGMKKAQCFYKSYVGGGYAAEFAQLVYYRSGVQLNPRNCNVLIKPAVMPKPLGELHAGVVYRVRLWFELLCRVLSADSQAVGGGNEQLRVELATFLRDWVCEVLYGFKPTGICVNLVERMGGVGKTLLAEILTSLLGDHQTQKVTDVKAMLGRGFNADMASCRFFYIDDANWNSAEQNAFKSFITAQTITINIKHGRNGVTMPFAGAFMVLANEAVLDATKMTARNRRHVHFAPKPIYEELLAALPLEMAGVARDHFGSTHEEFLAFGYNRLATRGVPSEEQVALASLMYEFYQRNSATLHDSLRQRVERQQLHTLTQVSAVVGGCGDMGDFIVQCLLHRHAFVDTRREVFTWPGNQAASDLWIPVGAAQRVAGVAEGTQLDSCYAVDTLRQLYNAMAEGNNFKRYVNSSKFKDDFVRTYEKIYSAINPNEKYRVETNKATKCMRYTAPLVGERALQLMNPDEQSKAVRCLVLRFDAFANYLKLM